MPPTPPRRPPTGILSSVAPVISPPMPASETKSNSPSMNTSPTLPTVSSILPLPLPISKATPLPSYCAELPTSMKPPTKPKSFSTRTTPSLTSSPSSQCPNPQHPHTRPPSYPNYISPVCTLKPPSLGAFTISNMLALR